MAILLCSAETVDARPTYIWLKDTTIGRSTAVEIFETLTRWIVEMPIFTTMSAILAIVLT